MQSVKCLCYCALGYILGAVMLPLHSRCVFCFNDVGFNFQYEVILQEHLLAFRDLHASHNIIFTVNMKHSCVSALLLFQRVA